MRKFKSDILHEYFEYDYLWRKMLRELIHFSSSSSFEELDRFESLESSDLKKIHQYYGSERFYKIIFFLKSKITETRLFAWDSELLNNRYVKCNGENHDLLEMDSLLIDLYKSKKRRDELNDIFLFPNITKKVDAEIGSFFTLDELFQIYGFIDYYKNIPYFELRGEDYDSLTKEEMKNYLDDIFYFSQHMEILNSILHDMKKYQYDIEKRFWSSLSDETK